MKITDAKVLVGGLGKNDATLKILSDQGVYGMGDATLNNLETLPSAYLQHTDPQPDPFHPCCRDQGGRDHPRQTHRRSGGPAPRAHRGPRRPQPFPDLDGNPSASQRMAPEFGIQVYRLLGIPDCDALFPSDHRMEQGHVYVSDDPGLGVDFCKAEAECYGYRPGTHPVVRLTDGTVWNC
jgi:L-alanine-DL-glutamate epimerase-like enolase superfamily enzyme